MGPFRVALVPATVPAMPSLASSLPLLIILSAGCAGSPDTGAPRSSPLPNQGADSRVQAGPAETQAAVTDTVKKQLAKIQGCYEAQLRLDPTLGGRIEVEIDLNEQGSVERSEVVKSTMGGSPEALQVGACIATAFRGFRFENPGGERVTLSYPFVFNVLP